MQDFDAQQLIARVERLERKNRRLTFACGLCLSLPLLAIVGWQSASDTVRVKRLEVVDAKGVPVITLAPSRSGQGGSVILRDAAGEKRSWWEVGTDNGAFSITSAKPDGTNDTTLGLQVGPKNGRVAIIGRNGGLFSANVEGDDPQVELYNAKGATVFAAPMRARKTE